MSTQEGKKKTGRDLLLILLLLPLGVCLMFTAGQAAIALAPSWVLDADMGSGIDPDLDYVARNNPELIEPILSGILTPPAWASVFLTPGAVIPDGGQPADNAKPPDQASEPPPSQPDTNPPVVPPPEVVPPVVVAVPPPGTNKKPPAPSEPPVEPPSEPPTDVPVDLKVTKSDGQTSYASNSTVTYSVVVTNIGSNDVDGAVIKDNLPTQIASWDWSCKTVTKASGCNPVTGGTSNFTDTVNIQAGGSIEYEVIAYIKGGAKNNLLNIASVSVPTGYKDMDTNNNSATDTDTLAAQSADLEIAKDDGVDSVLPSSNTTYTIRVTNNGPDSVTGAILTDPTANGLSKTTVACSPTPGVCATAPTIAELEGGSFALPALANGQFYEITITSNVIATSGSVENIATVDLPMGTNDPGPGKNSASDTDTVNMSADLWIEITDDSTDYTAKAIKTYTITVHNAGPSDVSGATVSNTFVNGNANSTTWTCNASAGAVCSSLTGAGDINNQSIDLNSGAYVTFYLAAQVVDSPSGDLKNMATVVAPVGVTDASGNNSKPDTDYLFEPTTFPSDLSSGSAPTTGDYHTLDDGDVLNLTLPTPVVVSSPDTDSWDIIYFEELNSGGVAMDWVTIKIGNGSNWYTILEWGNENPDTNTNISIPLAGNSGGFCSDEPDNCQIDGSFLFTDSGYTTGITIDVDGLGIPSGTYNYMRIIASGGSGSGDGNIKIDGFYVKP